MTEAERAKAEKEIMGLNAKLKWSHIPESTKDVWRQRIEELRASLSQ